MYEYKSVKINLSGMASKKPAAVAHVCGSMGRPELGAGCHQSGASESAAGLSSGDQVFPFLAVSLSA